MLTWVIVLGLPTLVSAGSYGTGLSIDVTVEGGQVTQVFSNAQGEIYQIGAGHSSKTSFDIGGTGNGL